MAPFQRLARRRRCEKVCGSKVMGQETIRCHHANRRFNIPRVKAFGKTKPRICVHGGDVDLRITRDDGCGFLAIARIISPPSSSTKCACCALHNIEIFIDKALRSYRTENLNGFAVCHCCKRPCHNGSSSAAPTPGEILPQSTPRRRPPEVYYVSLEAERPICVFEWLAIDNVGHPDRLLNELECEPHLLLALDR